MEIMVNYWAVLVCAVLAMVVGAIWYGPIFGKKWMEIIGATEMDEVRRKEMQKGANKLYVVNFLLVLFQVLVLAHLMTEAVVVSGFERALWIWAGFVMPTIAASSMWNNDSARISWARFLIQSGYQFVMFLVFATILTYWK